MSLHGPVKQDSVHAKSPNPKSQILIIRIRTHKACNVVETAV